MIWIIVEKGQSLPLQHVFIAYGHVWPSHIKIIFSQLQSIIVTAMWHPKLDLDNYINLVRDRRACVYFISGGLIKIESNNK